MKRLVILALALFIGGGSCSAYASGNILGGWFDGKPVNPPVTPPPVTPPPPVQTAVIEHGTKAAYASETDWYFVHPIGFYKTFDLFFVDGSGNKKKVTISMAYTDSQIEVRNSETRKPVAMVVIAPASYRDYRDVYVSYPSGGTTTVPPVTPPVTPPADGDVPLTMHYNHVNQQSFDGRGVSIIMCKGAPGLKSVTINGVKLRLHGDRGPNCDRETWTNVDFINKTSTKITGWAIVEAKDGSKKKIKLDGNRQWFEHKGDCFINCGN